jgi:hypothetical protein
LRPHTTSTHLACLLALSAVLVLAPCHDAAASTARIHSLGGDGSYLEDYRNVLRWCGSLVDYPDIAVIETGHFDLTNGYDDEWGKSVSGPGGAIHARFDEAGRWGTGALYFHGNADDSDPGSLHRGYLGSSLTAMYGRNIAGVSGALFYRHSADTDFETVSTSQVPYPVSYDRGRDDIGLGVRVNLSGSAYLDLAGDVRHLSDRAGGSGPGGTTWDTGQQSSWNNYGLRARAFIALGDRLALVPLVEYISEDFTGTSYAGAALLQETSDNVGDFLRMGAGLNYFIDTDNLLLFSLDFQDGQVDHTIRNLDGEVDDTWREDYSAFLILLAFESRLAHWVTFRASSGYEHLDNNGDLPNPPTGDHIPLGLGLGFHLGSIALDLALTDREPRPVSRYSATLPAEESSTWLTITLSYGF